MILRSLGLRSDLALIDGEVLDRDSYLVVRSPREPGYYWGNLLVFPQAPGPGDLARWEHLFAQEFANDPEVAHRTFAWDLGDAPWDPGPFLEAGYHHEQTVVLTASEVCLPPHPNTEIEVRTLQTQADWDEVAELHVATRDLEHEEEAYRQFATRRLAALRARVDAGQGEWYGAFRDGRQLASLGIVRSGTMARFQIVVTHPEARRQGLCGTLVHQVAQAALDRPDVESLVMLADSEYHAARIYESVGFSPSEKLDGLCRWPR